MNRGAFDFHPKKLQSISSSTETSTKNGLAFLSSSSEVKDLIRVWLAGLRHQEAMESEITPIPSSHVPAEGKPYCRIDITEPEWAEFLFRKRNSVPMPITEEGMFFLRYLQKKEEVARKYHREYAPEPYFIFPAILFKNHRGLSRIGGLIKADCPSFSFPSASETKNASEEDSKNLFFHLKSEEGDTFNFWFDLIILEQVLKLHEDQVSALRILAEKTENFRELAEKIFPILWGRTIPGGINEPELLQVFVETLEKNVKETSGNIAKVYPHALLCDLNQAFVTGQLQRDLAEILDEESIEEPAKDSPYSTFLFGESDSPVSDKFSFFQNAPETLSESQQKAYRFSKKNKTSVIEGPPGSGKTHLIRHLLSEQIIAHALKMKPGFRSSANFRTLITGVNNQAVDQAMIGLNFENSLPVAVRLGSYLKLEEVTLPFLKAYYRDLSVKDPEEEKAVFQKNHELLTAFAERGETEPAIDPFFTAVCVVESWAGIHQEEIMRLLLEIIQDIEDRKGLKAFYRKKNFELFFHIFPVVGCTLLSIRNLFRMEADLIDTLILDEAGQCLPVYAFPALFRSKNAVFLGDTKQLQPISKLSIKDWERILSHRKSTTLDYENRKEYLPDSERPTSVQEIFEKAAGDNLISLKEHYRCAPPIVNLINELSGYGLSIRTKNAPHLGKLKDQSFWHINHESPEKESFGSWANPTEESLIVRLVRDLLRQGISRGDIAILTPYRGQFFRLSNALRKSKIPTISGEKAEDSGGEIIAGTVHRFQGGEREVVIFSHVNHLRDPIFMNTNVNLLNVAISRAKQRFFFVGNLENLKRGKFTSVLHHHLQEFGEAYSLEETPGESIPEDQNQLFS